MPRKAVRTVTPEKGKNLIAPEDPAAIKRQIR
jgi:hypothetical protein